MPDKKSLVFSGIILSEIIRFAVRHCIQDAQIAGQRQQFTQSTMYNERIYCIEQVFLIKSMKKRERTFIVQEYYL